MVVGGVVKALSALQKTVFLFSVHPSLHVFVNGAGDVLRPWAKTKRFQQDERQRARKYFPSELCILCLQEGFWRC